MERNKSHSYLLNYKSIYLDYFEREICLNLMKFIKYKETVFSVYVWSLIKNYKLYYRKK